MSNNHLSDSVSDRRRSSAGVDHLIELLEMRPRMAAAERKAFELTQHLEEFAQKHDRSYRKLLETAVHLVDELVRLTAESNVALQPSDSSPPSPAPVVAKSEKRSFWRKKLNKEPARPEAPAGQSTSAAQDWLAAFNRLSAAAINHLAAFDVVRVPLLGQDLRELKYENQLVKNWVAVKSRSQEQAFVVREEMRGLWVGKRDGQLIAVQRGEVGV